MSSAADTVTSQALDPESMHEIQRALGNMPYGALVGAPARFETVAEVVAWLEAFAACLDGVTTRNRQVEAERDELCRQRDAIRRFLGVSDA